MQIRSQATPWKFDIPIKPIDGINITEDVTYEFKHELSGSVTYKPGGLVVFTSDRYPITGTGYSHKEAWIDFNTRYIEFYKKNREMLDEK